MKEIKTHTKKWTYWFLLGVALIIIYKALDNFQDVFGAMGKFLSLLSPFFVGLFIAYLLYLPCRTIENLYRKRKSKFIQKRARSLSVITVYLIAIIFVIILTMFILPVIWESIIDLANNIQGYYETTIRNFNKLPEDSFLKSEFIKEAVQNVQNLDIKQYFQLDKLFEYLKNAISAITSVFDVFVSFVVSVYILIERKEILAFFKRLAGAIFPQKTYQNVSKYFNNSNEIFFHFIASQFLDAIIVGILTTIAMSIMGIKYAPLLGFFIGLFNMIPYIGAIIAVGISAVITLITGGLTQAIWMLIVVIILQQIDANIINPKIIGRSLKMSPLLVLLAITIGGAYFGILGMFLAVPVMAIAKLVVEDSLLYWGRGKKR